MAASITVYTDFSKYINQGVDFLADAIKGMLISSAQAPDRDADHFISDINANEVAGAGYVAGGKALTTKTEVIDAANHRTKYKADDLSWAAATIGPMRYCILYKDTGVPGTSRVVAFVDFGADQSVTAGTFTIAWNANGIFTATCA